VKYLKKLFFNKVLFLFFCIIGALTVVIVLFLRFVKSELLNDSICQKWHENMTPNEKISMVLEGVNNADFLSFDVDTSNDRRVLRKQISYGNFEEIILKNPECCKLYSSDTALSETPLEWIDMKNKSPNSKDEGTVVLRYLGKYSNNVGMIKFAQTFSYANINLCR